MKCCAIVALSMALANAAPVMADPSEAQIETVLNVQLEAWNRGDIPAFVATYAGDCVFVGKQVAHGRAQVLARYQKNYPTRDAMGHLRFNGLEVHLLTNDIATVTGEWHLERPNAKEKSIGGLFSLVFHRQAKEWKIALDHTS